MKRNFKYHWIANLGVAMEIGAVIYILMGIFLLEWSKIIAGVTGGLLGLVLIFIGFLIQKKNF